jgi:endonuclease/exonuclease/phosphatase (EEP) superfamily protein YafD
MTFTILFWNIWLDNQIKGFDKSGPLLGELKRLSDEYKPNFMGLNEVLQATNSDKPFVSDFLKDVCGYAHSHYAPASPFTSDWLIGSALYSRHKFAIAESVPISNDTPAKRRGYAGCKLKVATARIHLGHKRSLNIIVAHPMHLRVHTLKDHYEGTANLEKLIRSEKYAQNTILGGDFNEPGFMPRAFKNRVHDVMNFKTGSKLWPTWRHNAYTLTPVRANLDQLYWSKNSQFQLTEFKVLDSNISDHRPLLATFEYL